MNGRIENSIRNSFFGFVLKIITLFGSFAARSMLIYCLGVEYVGLEGLFSSILTMLNMAELGFGSAVVYKLYGPLARNDTDRVCALLKYYKKIYTTIGWVVFTIGVILVPFLNFFVKGSAPEDVSIYILYIIYLLNTCFSYWFFAYKSVLLNAINRNDIVSKVSSVVSLARYVLQFVLLMLFRNYYVYVIVIPIITLLSNVGNAIAVRKMYPQYVCRGNADMEDRQEIKTKVSALVFNKIGVTIITASDNIVISSFLGLSILGIYDSYYYIFMMLYYFFSVFHSAITAGVGNSIIVESVEQNYAIFKRLSFINSWVVGWASICLACLYEPFIGLWIGNDKALGTGFALLMSMHFYCWMIRFITTIFKNAQGLWTEDKYRACIEGGVNLLLNLIMVNIIGIYGITISTIVSMLVISLPWETNVLFKKYFKRSTFEYYIKMVKWFVVVVAVGTICFLICNGINVYGIAGITIRVLICLIIPNLAFFAFFGKKDEFEYAVQLVNRTIKKITK